MMDTFKCSNRDLENQLGARALTYYAPTIYGRDKLSCEKVLPNGAEL
jgi:hypothetical protein